MTQQSLVLLLVGLVGLLIPVALYYFYERPDRASGRSWFRTREGIRRPSAETMAMLRRWYDGKRCALCAQPIAPMHGDSRPGLLDRTTRRATAWDEVAEADLPRALEQHDPICASCVTAESFRAQYPDLVVDRAATPLRDSATH
jgi:hypothetical protein